MLRSLFSAISGLRANQTMLDVTGNNIANSNTPGYKTSNIIFQDTLSQMMTAAGSPSAAGADPAHGGTNPMQVGLGVQVGGISTNFTQGAQQNTGSPTHLMIQGDGFFVINRNGEDLYTRLGAFNFDKQGNLVTLDGDIVANKDGDGITIPDMAEGAAPDPKLLSFNIGADGKIMGVYADGAGPVELEQIGLAYFANPAGLEKAGDSAFRASANSGQPTVGVPGEGKGILVGGALEMSNVDLAQEFTNLIIAQRGFQANSRVITTSDQVLEELVNIKR